MAIKYSSRVEGAALRALQPSTLIASYTDGREHSGHFQPTKEQEPAGARRRPTCSRRSSG